MVSTKLEIPEIIQGGMGIGVSGWRLAGAAAKAGAMGVVSGVALDTITARKLQDGDPGGHIREALEAFPVPEISRYVLDRYWNRLGRPGGSPYKLLARPTLSPSPHRQWVSVLSAFVEVYLAKRAAGPGGVVGINFLEKVQLSNPPATYGAMLAGVDAVLVGAGIPAKFPEMLRAFSRHERFELPVEVDGGGRERHHLVFDPASLIGESPDELVVPSFLAIVSSDTLATFLARDPATRPDGFVVESPEAGGHNAPPRGQLRLDDHGEPVYGPRDRADLEKLTAVGLPFWLAGGQAHSYSLSQAKRSGARGIQTGTMFALCEESGIEPQLRQRLLALLARGGLNVRTDPKASPTGFPFKLVELEGSMADPAVRLSRERSCDLGYLRTAYVTPKGTVSYRCPAERTASFVHKGGSEGDASGRLCLCNGLMSNIGLAQTRRDGYREPPAITLGADLSGPAEMLIAHPGGWDAADVVRFLSGT